MIKKLALVEKVYLEYQERHILTVNCLVSYEDFGSQNIMNIVLDTWDKEKQKRVGTAEGMSFLISFINTPLIILFKVTPITHHIQPAYRVSCVK